MHFFDGKLGAYERLMTEKPGFYRKDSKDDAQDSKPCPTKQEQAPAPKESEENGNA